MSPGPVTRWEAGLKVTGQAVFAAETPAPGLLYAVLVEAPVGCGTVLAVDAAQARRTPGFADLISYPEAQGLKPSSVTALIREPTIHFAGQPVALVVAENLAAAQAAARAVRVEAEARPAIAALGQALDQAYTPATAGRNPAESRRGDAARALAEAHLVVRRRYETAVNNHHPMEPHAVVCCWEGDRVTVHTSTQAVFGARAAIAHAFGLPAEDARVVSRFLGGGFGCKGQLWWPWMMQAMLAARRTGRPVRLELTRAQLFTLAGRRSETVQELAVGLDADGRLTAIDHQVLAQTSTHGEYADTTAGVSRWLYACPNVTTRHRLVRTNEPQPIPMRAPGTAPGTFALESALDEAAAALGIDPVDLRVRNHGDHDQEAGRPWSSKRLLECYRVGAERFGWAHRPAAGAAGDGRWRLGSGMASTFYAQHLQPSRARVRLAADASLVVQCGTQDMGNGAYTALGQMAAEALGVPMSRVTVELGDTLLPQGPISAGSQVTVSISPAVAMATAELRAILAQLAVADQASPLAGQRPEDLDFADGLVRSRTGNVAEPLADLLARQAPAGLEAEGSADLPQVQTHSFMSHGAVFVEVGVDPDLGEVRVRRVCAAFAAGRIVNPLLATSQYVGGLIGGIGMALHERTVTDLASGRILGDNFADYLIPVHADMPTFDIALVHEDDTHLPGGIKGVGMLGTAGVQAAIANAIFDAVGRRVRRLPIRIEDILGHPDPRDGFETLT
ncbi:xanthine dehydrogenase family protein molybdopterin-binding subunit [Phenylobacterium sp.]|uniref:xanthine dehydrogenase family protein molybdopterin-binding subunit n=1 Tax=Phenylobacterium sp. TaxID=1871053 RepID=UPI0025D507A8|nr:xanthine dehydrogenase family protein molybdopterin-binding subunit [Phenylobacterium sp.]